MYKLDIKLITYLISYDFKKKLFFAPKCCFFVNCGHIVNTPENVFVYFFSHLIRNVSLKPEYTYFSVISSGFLSFSQKKKFDQLHL